MADIKTETPVQDEAENKVSIVAKAAEGVRSGAVDAGESARHLFAKVGQLGGKGIYGVCYGVSYGATFAALTVANVLPESALRGFRDGAKAAEASLHKPVTEETAQPA
ncbi:hypothetical protein MIT9_P0216 [Methylomarinovum caldicuralii]|uniref:Uncharacterized protein n=1 Tax=Methylomarinovum caldicuralii TaxID=438856 RepID=A0AAU9BXD2_9GAMM|nr:hypothetical protein [Methylomarinovum caldicuralii]BCX80642.1 hypothetical protein MIT9_P0216 [Methylomarinovum caldicuralii]